MVVLSYTALVAEYPATAVRDRRWARMAADGNCSILGQPFGTIWKFHLKSKIN
jgi:hypothetical protein